MGITNFKMATNQTWEYIEDLLTDKTICDECKCDLILSNKPPAEITCYTRDGTKFAQHFRKECPNRWCRKTFFYGYTVKNGVKIYESDSLRNKKYLLVSTETAFTVDFCNETTLQILHNNATFNGLENVYNSFHNFNEINISRVNIYRKRLSTAFFLYGFLEFTFRHGIYHEFKEGNTWIEDTILEYYNIVKAQFSKHWTSEHSCNVPNCKTMFVTDGGMKIHRSVCAAKFSTVRKFNHSNKSVLTGCTASPSPNSPFFPVHKHAESPIIINIYLSNQ